VTRKKYILYFPSRPPRKYIHARDDIATEKPNSIILYLDRGRAFGSTFFILFSAVFYTTYEQTTNVAARASPGRS